MTALSAERRADRVVGVDRGRLPVEHGHDQAECMFPGEDDRR
ncbi:hypothetical protein [Salinispora tropica]